MKTDEIPKGVKFSYFMMSFPLICTTTYLGLLAPMVSASTGMVDPQSFAYLGRTCMRLLALNISFQGGIHYGLASATYETAVTDEELKHIRRQLIFSFVPAAMSFSFTSMLLFSSPITLPTVLISFTGLMLTQLLTLQVDLKCVERELAPRWFLKFRTTTFGIYMLLTSILLLIYYTKLPYLQRKHDKNRITNIKNAL
jgi:Protein of unknown function (DUF3429)